MLGNLLDNYGAKSSFYQISRIAMTFKAHIVKTGERTLCLGRITWRHLQYTVNLVIWLTSTKTAFTKVPFNGECMYLATL